MLRSLSDKFYVTGMEHALSFGPSLSSTISDHRDSQNVEYASPTLPPLKQRWWLAVHRLSLNPNAGMVSEEAASMLASEWEGVGDTIGAGWKGRSTALAELLHMHISAAADPLALVNILSGGL